MLGLANLGMKRGYFIDSATPFYGAITGLVMMVAYEILIVLEPLKGTMARNASEVWFRYMISFFGVSGHLITYMMMMISFFLILIFYRQGLIFRVRTFVIMLLEGALLGLLTGWLIQSLLHSVLWANPSESEARNLGLAIGAGLFEELVFRVLLIAILYRLFRFFFVFKIPSSVASILTASFLFSLYHYIGPYSDTFEVYSFLHRFLGGLWLTSLYFYRGFGIACLTHAFYDIFIVLS